MSGPHPDPMELVAHLEPAAVHQMGTSDAEVFMASIAISLKRIADALAPPAGQDIGLTLFFAGQAVERLAGRA